MEIEQLGETAQPTQQQANLSNNIALLPNEQLYSSIIKTKIKDIQEKKNDKSEITEFDNPVEIYTTNMRFIIQISQKDDKNDQKSIFYKDINNFRIEEIKNPIKSYITHSQIKFERDSKSTSVIYTFDKISQKEAKMLTDKVIEEEEIRLSKRLALLNQCLGANETVECKPIEIKLQVILEKYITSESDKPHIYDEYKMAFCEIFITNYRFLMIIYDKTNEDLFHERSIFYHLIENFKIEIPDLKSGDSIKYNAIKYTKDNNQITVAIVTERLQQQDKKKLEDSFEKYKTLLQKTNPTSEQLDFVVKKQILEKDQKLNTFFKHAVQNKKMLSEEQFWKNNEEYQKFLKFKQRDEEKIKRDYLETEIPLVRKEIQFPVEVDQLDERVNKFNQFRKEIYDPTGLIEGQNLLSFQQYKQNVYFFGQIDQQNQKIIENKKKNQQDNIEEINIDDTHHHNNHNHHLVIIEEYLDSVQVSSNATQEMKTEEYKMKLSQNAKPEKQNQLDKFLNGIQIQSNQRSQDLLKEFKQGDLKKIDPKDPSYQEKCQEALKKVGQRVQSAWKQAFECLYKLKPLSQSAQNSSIYKRDYETYQGDFYQCREILRWLYKEINNGDKARPEIIDTLKSELEQTRSIINEELRKVNESLKQISEKEQRDRNDDNPKSVYLQAKERLQDLLDSFIFKQPNI